MAYAFELLAAKDGKGHVAADHGAAAARTSTETGGTVGGVGAGDALADARRAGHVRRVHAGRGEGLHGARPTANVISTAGDAALTVSDPAT